MRALLTKVFYCLCLCLSMACSNSTPPPAPPTPTLYFPPIGSSTWESVSPESLGWNSAQIPQLLDFLEDNNTRAFMVLKDGKIVMEHYFGNNFQGAPFQASSNWYWASAAKTLTAFVVGRAEEEGFLSLQDPTNQYLGNGWTSLSPAQEAQINIWHQLTMSSGLDDGVPNRDCTTPDCLQYLAAPNTRWAYHNAPYTLLDEVVSAATGQNFNDYFAAQLRNKIGMDGFWQDIDFNRVYFSTARSMARFGLLIQNEGRWNETTVLNEDYVKSMISTSQTLNPAYGYLWWLNGKSTFRVPGSQISFAGSISPSAPADMVAAMGRDGQLLNIVPSKGIVLVRMGDNPDSSLVPFTFQNMIWEKFSLVLGE